MKNYEELKKMLDRLYKQLLIPIGGHNDVAKAIWMEVPDRRLVTIANDEEFVTVASTGQVIRNKEVCEVEALYLVAFTSPVTFEFKDVIDGIVEENIA